MDLTPPDLTPPNWTITLHKDTSGDITAQAHYVSEYTGQVETTDLAALGDRLLWDITAQHVGKTTTNKAGLIWVDLAAPTPEFDHETITTTSGHTLTIDRTTPPYIWRHNPETGKRIRTAPGLQQPTTPPRGDSDDDSDDGGKGGRRMSGDHPDIPCDDDCQPCGNLDGPDGHWNQGGIPGGPIQYTRWADANQLRALLARVETLENELTALTADNVPANDDQIPIGQPIHFGHTPQTGWIIHALGQPQTTYTVVAQWSDGKGFYAIDQAALKQGDHELLLSFHTNEWQWCYLDHLVPSVTEPDPSWLETPSHGHLA